MSKKIEAIKAFDGQMKCLGFQYEIGKTYKHDGPVEVCETGFHAVYGHPLNLFQYYPPSSRFALVEMDGEIHRDFEDAKLAAEKITIKAEIHLPDVIQRAVDWVMERASFEEGQSATGYQGAASATGNQGAASATGEQGAASATGEQGAASATGYQGAASATGEQGAASATGYQGAVRGKAGCALFLVERNQSYEIVNVWSGIVGRDGVEPDVWYGLKNGQPVELTI